MKQVNVKIDDDVYIEVAERAKEQGESVGAWCRQAALERLKQPCKSEESSDSIIIDRLGKLIVQSNQLSNLLIECADNAQLAVEKSEEAADRSDTCESWAIVVAAGLAKKSGTIEEKIRSVVADRETILGWVNSAYEDDK